MRRRFRTVVEFPALTQRRYGKADGEPLEAANRATAHLYIVNPVMKLQGREGTSMWDSHPPIEDRIRRLREMT